MILKLKNPRISLIAAILIALIFSGCYYDNFEAIHPGAGLINNCDTTSPVTFSKQVTTVFSNYCVSCHSSSVASGGVSLDTYAGAINAESRLDGALHGTSGNIAMPPGTQIDECSIREIEMWINNGALNN
jgi:hypothetical protein